MGQRANVIVIGAGPGLGASLARRAAAAGAHVNVISRSPSTVDPLVSELAQTGADVHGWCADASIEASLRTTIQNIMSQSGPPTHVFYNAVDPLPKGGALGVSPAALEDSLATNLTGALVTVQETIDPMREAGGGSIVLTGGVLASKPWAAMSALSIGKAAMRSLALCLHQEIGEQDPVHLVTITIGGVIKEGTPFDPAGIADTFWNVCEARDFGRGGEIIYRGAP